MNLIHVSVGGPDRVIVDEAGKEWKFEDHPAFGPQILNRDGSIKTTQPGSRSPFWSVWEWWRDGGKVLHADGRCKWVKPTKAAEPALVHLGGRHYAHAGSALARKYGGKK